MRTIVGTHSETHPKWKAWSQAVAYAEEVPTPGSDAEVQAWARADELWAEYELWLEEQKGDHIYKTAVIVPIKPCVPKSNNIISLPADDYWGAGR